MGILKKMSVLDEMHEISSDNTEIHNFFFTLFGKFMKLLNVSNQNVKLLVL